MWKACRMQGATRSTRMLQKCWHACARAHTHTHPPTQPHTQSHLMDEASGHCHYPGSAAWPPPPASWLTGLEVILYDRVEARRHQAAQQQEEGHDEAPRHDEAVAKARPAPVDGLPAWAGWGVAQGGQSAGAADGPAGTTRPWTGDQPRT